MNTQCTGAVVVVLAWCTAFSTACIEVEEPAMFVRRHRHTEVFAPRRRFWPTGKLMHALGMHLNIARDRTGRYPHLWSLVEPEMQLRDAPPGRVATPHSASWWIDEVEHRFVIEAASDTHYVVRAYDGDERLTFEMDECGRARQMAAHYCDCHLERKEEEPVSFLKRANHFFYRFHEERRRYPFSWAETRAVVEYRSWPSELHWINGERHLEDDPRALAPPSATDAWQPYGSDFTYVLSNIGRESFTISSHNDNGLTDYTISLYDDKPSPVEDSKGSTEKAAASSTPQATPSP